MEARHILHGPKDGSASQPTALGADLGSFLRDRRARVAPQAETQGYRRTPGLRREEVAARAGVSMTWYTHLEQGRGGRPSDAVLTRLARALELDSTAREMLFLLARPSHPASEDAERRALPRAVQAFIDGMDLIPALVCTPTLDIVAWNSAASVMFSNLEGLSGYQRNILWQMFEQDGIRRKLVDWEDHARFLVSLFRMNAARSHNGPAASRLVEHLQNSDPDFGRLWSENELRTYEINIWKLRVPGEGVVAFEAIPLHVIGSDDLTIIALSARSPGDAIAVRRLVATR